jgi:hypothetical protein
MINFEDLKKIGKALGITEEDSASFFDRLKAIPERDVLNRVNTVLESHVCKAYTDANSPWAHGYHAAIHKMADVIKVWMKDGIPKEIQPFPTDVKFAADMLAASPFIQLDQWRWYDQDRGTMITQDRFKADGCNLTNIYNEAKAYVIEASAVETVKKLS